ncbi:COP9 signalosome complex subunit 2, partial [Diplonema papillatum]
MSDDEYVYEEDEEYASEGAEENDDALEGIYYDAKDKIEDEPGEAVKGFLALLDRDEDETNYPKWAWKAMKRLVRVYFKLQKFDEMTAMYRRLLRYEWSGRTRNDTEKAINKLLDLTSGAAGSTSAVTAAMYEITTEYVGEGARNEKLWFAIKMKSAQVQLDNNDHQQCKKTLAELKDSCRMADSPGSWDKKKGTQLMTIFATEIQLYQGLGDFEKLKNLYHEAMAVEGAIPPPKITGIIKEAGGKMYMEQDDYEQANEAFFQAFKHYDEAGHPRRIQCLRYLVVANMMSRSKINPFDCQEAKPYKTDPEIAVMTDLVEAANNKNITAFENILKQNLRMITSDPLIDKYISPLLRTVRMQVLQQNVKGYTTIRLAYLADDLSIPEAEVEELLVAMLLDDELSGGIDQV